MVEGLGIVLLFDVMLCVVEVVVVLEVSCLLFLLLMVWFGDGFIVGCKIVILVVDGVVGVSVVVVYGVLFGVGVVLCFVVFCIGLVVMEDEVLIEVDVLLENEFGVFFDVMVLLDGVGVVVFLVVDGYIFEFLCD